MKLLTPTSHAVSGHEVGDERWPDPEELDDVPATLRRPSARPCASRGAATGARLVVAVGRARGQTIPIRGRRFFIGREPDCQLRPRNPLISRYHAALEFRDGGVFVRDLGSTNGTVVNGRTLDQEAAEVFDNARLRIGPLRFLVQVGEDGLCAAAGSDGLDARRRRTTRWGHDPCAATLLGSSPGVSLGTGLLAGTGR